MNLLKMFFLIGSILFIGGCAAFSEASFDKESDKISMNASIQGSLQAGDPQVFRSIITNISGKDLTVNGDSCILEFQTEITDEDGNYADLAFGDQFCLDEPITKTFLSGESFTSNKEFIINEPGDYYIEVSYYDHFEASIPLTIH